MKRKRIAIAVRSETYESPYFEDYDMCSDSHSLAWRYLGVFIDEYDGYYSRKVLWAAVSPVQ